MSKKIDATDGFQEACDKSNDMNPNFFKSLDGTVAKIFNKLDSLEKDKQETGKKIGEMYSWLLNNEKTGEEGLLKNVKVNTLSINELVRFQEIEQVKRTAEDLPNRMDNLEEYFENLEKERAIEKAKIKLIAAVITVAGGAVFTFINKVLLK